MMELPPQMQIDKLQQQLAESERKRGELVESIEAALASQVNSMWLPSRTTQIIEMFTTALAANKEVAG